MTRTWKCDFCSETNDDVKSMETHERECGVNPNNKTCRSCRFFEKIWGDNGFVQCTENVKDFHDIEDDELPCSSWEFNGTKGDKQMSMQKCKCGEAFYDKDCFLAHIQTCKKDVKAKAESDLIDCPFCGDVDFDLPGLKNHFNKGYCDIFNETIDLV